MKNALVAIAALGLSGCVTASEDGKLPVSTVDKVQTAALYACVFYPTAAEIAKVIADNKDALDKPNKIVDILCAAVIKARSVQ